MKLNFREGTLNLKFFSEYMVQCLAPVMKNGDTLVLDNLSSHKVKNAVKPLIDMGVSLVFPPKYSPDFNPIKLAWSKMKSVIRKFEARTHDLLIDGLKLAFNSFKYSDILY